MKTRTKQRMKKECCFSFLFFSLKWYGWKEERKKKELRIKRNKLVWNMGRASISKFDVVKPNRSRFHSSPLSLLKQKRKIRNRNRKKKRIKKKKENKKKKKRKKKKEKKKKKKKKKKTLKTISLLNTNQFNSLERNILDKRCRFFINGSNFNSPVFCQNCNYKWEAVSYLF